MQFMCREAIVCSSILHAFGLAPFTLQAALLQTAHIAFHISIAACKWVVNWKWEHLKKVLQTSAYIYLMLCAAIFFLKTHKYINAWPKGRKIDELTGTYENDELTSKVMQIHPLGMWNAMWAVCSSAACNVKEPNQTHEGLKSTQWLLCT